MLKIDKNTSEPLVNRHNSSKTLLGLKVKKDTTWANLFAIFYVSFIDFAGAGYYNAQMTFLLESQDHFAISRE